ncbi:MAG: hypothetical protein R3C58_13055 [Parvularculaceae bacterium]
MKKFSIIMLAGVAALALGACGKKDKAADAPASASSAQGAKASAASPLDSRFTLKGGDPLDVDAFLALFPEKSRPTYKSAEFDKSLGATVVTGLRFADAEDGEAVVVERAEFFGVDMAAIERVKSAANAGSEAPFETIFQKVRFHGVSTEGYAEGDETADLKIGAVEFDTLQVRQGGLAVGDETDGGGARFFNSFNLAGLYVKDMTAKAEGTNSPKLGLTLPDLRVVGIGGGKVAAIIANDLDYTMNHSDESLAILRTSMGPEGVMFFDGPLGGFIAPKSQGMTAKQFEWRNIDFSGIMDWGLKGEKPPLTAEKLLDLGTMRMTKVDTYVNGKHAATMAEATMSAGEFTWLAPSNIRIDTKGAVYDLTAYVADTEEAALKILRDNGLNSVKGDGYASWVWNAKSGAADLNYVGNMEKFASFSMSTGFSDLKLADLAAAIEDGETNVIAGHGAFRNFSIKLKDDKALDAVFALAALQTGGTGEELRNSAPGLVRITGSQFTQINPRFSGYVDAVATFLAKGGTLEISAAPAKPASFATLQSTAMTAPQTLPDALDLKVTRKD